MKKLFLALMAVAAIALTGCNGHNPITEPDEDFILESGKRILPIKCSCGKVYNVYKTDKSATDIYSKIPYKVYPSGRGERWTIRLDSKFYPFATYNEDMKNFDGYCFWKCKCGQYHQVTRDKDEHTVYADGDQPSAWNVYNYLWE